MFKLFSISLLLLFSAIVSAEIAGLTFETEAQEQRFRGLSAEFRCLVCQNQSLSDSNAELANDLRTELYEQVMKNYTDEQIITFMTDRYGEFVLYKPRFNVKTALLWLLPFLLFVISVIALVRFSHKAGSAPSRQVSDVELHKIRELLETESETK